MTLQSLLTILNSTKSTDISGAIRLLPQDDQDTLMKYLYKGMATPGGGDISCSTLLAWHEKVGSWNGISRPQSSDPCAVDGNRGHRLYSPYNDRSTDCVEQY